jgi:hypothetical protein
MFDRIAAGWELMKCSWAVLWEDRKLLVFPLLSGAACLVVLASFALPLWQSEHLKTVTQDHKAPTEVLSYLILFAFYFANYFVIIFFNSALIGCVMARFDGREAGVGDGLRMAAERLPQILGWALVAATVGLILRIIEDRSEKVGRIVAGLLGMAWSILTYFVVPVIVVERAGPVEAFKRSASVMRKTWGESLVSNFSMGLIFFVLTLPAILMIAIGIMSGSVLAIPLIGFAVLYFIALSLVHSALNGILLAALYRYATQRGVPRHFSADTLGSAFARR